MLFEQTDSFDRLGRPLHCSDVTITFNGNLINTAGERAEKMTTVAATTLALFEAMPMLLCQCCQRLSLRSYHSARTKHHHHHHLIVVTANGAGACRQMTAAAAALPCFPFLSPPSFSFLVCLFVCDRSSIVVLKLYSFLFHPCFQFGIIIYGPLNTNCHVAPSSSSSSSPLSIFH